jgi:AcrR family transcriptional regulator
MTAIIDEAIPKRREGGRSARIGQQVQHAVQQLLIEGEGDAITIAAIAERSGVHLSTIYRRWGDVSTLLLEVALDIASSQMPVVDTGALATDLLAHARQAVAFVGAPAGRLLIRGLLDAEPDRRRWYWEQRFATIRLPFDRAIARGEIAEHAPVLDALSNLTGALYFRVLFSGTDADPESTARAIVDVALHTVGATRPAALKGA